MTNRLSSLDQRCAIISGIQPEIQPEVEEDETFNFFYFLFF